MPETPCRTTLTRDEIIPCSSQKRVHLFKRSALQRAALCRERLFCRKHLFDVAEAALELGVGRPHPKSERIPALSRPVKLAHSVRYRTTNTGTLPSTRTSDV